MARFYVLIKRKNSKTVLGAIPARKGISRTDLRNSARRQVGKRFNFRIIAESDLKKMFKNLVASKRRGFIKRKKRGGKRG